MELDISAMVAHIQLIKLIKWVRLTLRNMDRILRYPYNFYKQSTSCTGTAFALCSLLVPLQRQHADLGMRPTQKHALKYA